VGDALLLAALVSELGLGVLASLLVVVPVSKLSLGVLTLPALIVIALSVLTPSLLALVIPLSCLSVSILFPTLVSSGVVVRLVAVFLAGLVDVLVHG
jgi:hypothetical protein